MDYIGEWGEGRGDLTRTQMERLKFKLRHPDRSVTQAYCTSLPHMTCCNALKRHSTVTSYLIQQINSMLFSQDVQGMYWSCDKRKPLVKFCISKARDEKWWNWRTCCSLGTGPGWLKASSPQTEPRIKRTESLLSPSRTVCCWRLVREGWKCCDWKENWKYLMGTL